MIIKLLPQIPNNKIYFLKINEQYLKFFIFTNMYSEKRNHWRSSLVIDPTQSKNIMIYDS